MTQPHKPRPYDAIERRIHDLEAAKFRHYNLTRIARLEREVAALPDPTPPSAGEMASRASNARADAILRDMARLEAACDRS
jgi:hypothetical protein